MKERLIIYTLSVKDSGVKRIKKRLVDVELGELRIPQGRGLIYLEHKKGESKLIVSSTSAVSIKASELELETLKGGGVLKEESSIYHALNIQPLLEIGNIDFDSAVLEGIEVK